jgi:hypothetical protein
MATTEALARTITTMMASEEEVTMEASLAEVASITTRMEEAREDTMMTNP